MSSTRTLVTLLRPWIRRFTIIISAWWLRTSSKFTWEEVKTSTGKLGKWSTPKRVRIRPKYSAPSLSRDRRIKMHQSINHQSSSVFLQYNKAFQTNFTMQIISTIIALYNYKVPVIIKKKQLHILSWKITGKLYKHFPGLSRTYKQNSRTFKDFPGQQKKSRTFQDFSRMWQP